MKMEKIRVVYLCYKNVTSNFDIDEVIINPIKYIRKIRQVPAHELTWGQR